MCHGPHKLCVIACCNTNDGWIHQSKLSVIKLQLLVLTCLVHASKQSQNDQTQSFPNFRFGMSITNRKVGQNYQNYLIDCKNKCAAAGICRSDLPGTVEAGLQHELLRRWTQGSCICTRHPRVAADRPWLASIQWHLAFLQHTQDLHGRELHADVSSARNKVIELVVWYHKMQALAACWMLRDKDSQSLFRHWALMSASGKMIPHVDAQWSEWTHINCSWQSNR